jgi:hypothetical protein
MILNIVRQWTDDIKYCWTDDIDYHLLLKRSEYLSNAQNVWLVNGLLPNFIQTRHHGWSPTRLYLANLCTGFTYIRLSFNLYVQWFV